jgi:hypothetical protein
MGRRTKAPDGKNGLTDSAPKKKTEPEVAGLRSKSTSKSKEGITYIGSKNEFSH